MDDLNSPALIWEKSCCCVLEVHLNMNLKMFRLIKNPVKYDDY